MPQPVHGGQHLSEPGGGGAARAAVPAYFVDGGSGDVTINTVGPEQYAFFLVGSDYVLVNLTPVSGAYHDTAGNVVAGLDPATTPRLHAVSFGGAIILIA